MARELSAKGGKPLGPLEGAGARAKRLAKVLEGTAPNYFEALELVQSIENDLASLDACREYLRNQAQDLAEKCARSQADFWESFSKTLTQYGWNIVGKTERRLLERGIFVELAGDKVSVDELGLTLGAMGVQVADALQSHVKDLRGWVGRPKEFLAALEKAYEAAPGDRERSLESIYKGTLLNLQKSSFWKQPTGATLVPLSRPAFRACLTAAMQAGGRTPKGRVPRFAASLQDRDAWELYSPGEGRVVQVGRLVLDDV
jgi:hypothetical protein